MMRLATTSDIERVECFYRLHGNTRESHPRSIAYLASVIEKNAVIIEEEMTAAPTTTVSTGRIVACRETLVMSTREDIESFFRVHTPGFVWPYQENDIVIYFAGMLTSGSSNTNFIERSNQMIRNLIGAASWREDRQIWANGHSLDDKNNPPTRPSRILFCFDTMLHDAEGTTNHKEKKVQFFHRRIGDFLPDEKASHTFTRTSTLPDGSGRQGKMNFVLYDIPLTQHQMERTKRNRYLITEVEQRRLLGTRIGFVGLSTGSVALEAFLREGIGGMIRVADHDVFETSNMNRMLFGTDREGTSKAELCVERINSVDPDIGTESFPEGVDDGTVHEFVQNCDLIVEECDDFPTKIRVRKVCQTLGIPLIMGTSQNGMIDIERYDIHGDLLARPFHLDDQSLLDKLLSTPNMSAVDKNRVLSHLYDMHPTSSRFLGSGMEIGKSISSWPQLAEEVFLNASALAHAARRILLGDERVVSGRFSIRMETLFSPCNRIATHSATTEDLGVGLAPYPRNPYSSNETEMATMKELLFVSHWARSAPSGANQQPWTTRVIVDAEKGPAMEVYFRKEAAEDHGFENNFAEGWIEMALGCMLLNAEIAAAHLGKEIRRGAIDTNVQSSSAVTIVLSKPKEKEAEKSIEEKKRFFHSLRYRTSARSSRPMDQMPEPLKEKLCDLGVLVVEEGEGSTSASLPTISNVRSAIVEERRTRLDDLEGVLTEVGTNQFQIHPQVLGLSEAETQMVKKLSARPDVVDFVSEQGFLREPLLKPFKEEIDRTNVFMILCNDGNNNVEKGRLLELVWLEVTLQDHGVRPFSLSKRQLELLGVPNAFFCIVPGRAA
eukprot:CAMPEP_0183738072 /NCGR_PEP_ID=MMETSP0737-20130205/53692_1 /TAXON_ID=385413 /ORGANISM="Thalassiosira miniscula, Strain CCMP1093" /LENGTH=834 /DNA_ID=CAMNT_0025972519 /DNA_START=343 /DNA_END=2847 /DNA_ORIENTATION=-